MPPLPADFGPCPRTLDDFLKYIVQRRAAEGLNRIVLARKPAPRRASGDKEERKDKKSKKDNKEVPVGTVYGGATEDANIAWVAAAAYRYPWSRFHRHELLRKRAFFLMDSIARIAPTASGTTAASMPTSAPELRVGGALVDRDRRRGRPTRGGLARGGGEGGR